MPQTQTWNAKDWVLTIGPYTVDGFGESDMVRLSYVNDRFTKKSGVDGKVTRSRNNASNLAEVTFVFMQNSKARANIEKLITIDGLTNMGVVPISLLNPKSGIKYVGAEAWLEKDPEEAMALEVGEVEYMFAVEKLIRSVNEVA